MTRMTAREYDNWRRFAEREPLGDARADLRAGVIASVIANVNRAKGVEAFAPSDFLPSFDPPLTAEELAAKEDEAARIAAWQAQALAQAEGS